MIRSVILGSIITACAGSSPPPSSKITGIAGTNTSQKPSHITTLRGEVSRDFIEMSHPNWRSYYDKAIPDPRVAKDLIQTGTNAHLVIYLGTWCGDSQREVSRLWKAMDLAIQAPVWSASYIILDRTLRFADGSPAQQNITAVPTFIVMSGNTEVGRIIEHAPAGIELELTRLLSKASTQTSRNP